MFRKRRHIETGRESTKSHQYSEANVMHILFSLLRIKGLYVVRPLLAYHQEALHMRHLVDGVLVKSVGCTRFGADN
jgi:hypothetical protein